MQCPRCRHRNPPQAKFCLECGVRLATACGQCGAALPADAKFCLECGQAVGAAPAAQARFASPDTYTPKHLAEKILTSKSALEGERKQVTVLFADLKGSMELLAERDPEEARNLLDPVLERMMAAVHRYEGTVNQVMGDGIMALFGAPVAHEDHAVRACYAALEMQAAIRRYAEDVRRTHGVATQIRIGLNSGEVVVRAIGNDLKMDYTAVGQTTHLAGRMEQLADPGSVLLTADTLRLAEGFIEIKPLGPMPVKGLDGPVEVYEMTGVGPRRSRLHAAAMRGLTKFVGRDRELEQLREALGRAAAGHGQVVAVVGEPGVGKSRLFYEFIRSHRVHGWLVLESGSVSYGKATAYLPVIDLLRGYFKIQDRDNQREIRDKVIGRVLGLDRSLEPLLPPVLALLDVPVEDPAWAALDPPQRRQRTLDAVKQLLLRESQVQPLLLVIEDLQWIDGETQALFDSVVNSLGSIHVLLLVNYRPEYEHRWGKKTYYTQLRLESLPPESTNELLRALLGDAPGLEPLKQMLRKRGNPFFLEETVRTLLETKVLEGERGAYRLARPVQNLQIPATVQAILASRIDRLPVEEKQLLQAASVIGKDVPYVLLRATAELPEEALQGGLARLEEAEFLHETHLFPDLEYTFKHALTLEVTYGSLLHERRRGLHARIVEAIEHLYADQLAEHVERLAHHALRGEAWDRAVTYGRQAGLRALLRSANREAAAHFDQALAALAHLPQTRETSELEIDVRFDLQGVLHTLGELGRTLDTLSRAETLAEALGDQHRLARASAHMTWVLFTMGNPRRAIEVGERAVAMASAVGDFSVEVLAKTRLGQSYCLQGEYHRATDILAGNVEALAGNRSYERFGMGFLPSVSCRNFLSLCLAARGDFAAGRTVAEEGARIAENYGQPQSVAFAYRGLGQLHLMQGNLTKAIPALERCVDIGERGEHLLMWCLAAGALGEAYGLAGRTAEAVTLLQKVVERSGAMKAVAHQAIALTSLSEAYLMAGRLTDALESAQRALALCRANEQRGFEARALLVLGEINGSLNPPEVSKAEDHYDQVLALASELGNRPLSAHCHLSIGKLYRQIGQATKANEHLTTAATMYREMDMRFWLEKTETLLGTPGRNDAGGA